MFSRNFSISPSSVNYINDVYHGDDSRRGYGILLPELCYGGQDMVVMQNHTSFFDYKSMPRYSTVSCGAHEPDVSYSVSSKFYVYNKSGVTLAELNSEGVDHVNIVSDGVEGMVRFEDDGSRSEYYYLKDHLGSVISVVPVTGQSSYSSAFAAEYGVYGEFDDFDAGELAVADVTESFTGKEFEGFAEEGGLGVYYFGRRYYDPDVGIWYSMDPAGQFASPWAYAGNGANPVIMVDEDGEFLFVAIGAAFAYGYIKNAVKTGEAVSWDNLKAGAWTAGGVAAVAVAPSAVLAAYAAVQGAVTAYSNCAGAGCTGAEYVEQFIYGVNTDLIFLKNAEKKFPIT
ncbi:MAG: RHS repeat-associated core domain-containing protein, partial [Fibrobacterota bacterium]